MNRTKNHPPLTPNLFRMKNLFRTSFKLLAVAGTLLFFNTGCQPQTQAEEGEARPTLVRTEQVANQTIENYLDFTGSVQAYEQAHIGAAQPARIERILVDVGDMVSQGQLLVEMDQTQLRQLRVQYQTLKNDLTRLDTLRRIGAATQQSFDQLKAQYDITKANLDNLVRLTEIRATIPGVITGRYNSPGELFAMTPGPAGRPAIVSIMQIRPVKITVNVSERFFPQVRRGLTARVTSDLFPGRNFPGRIDKIYPTIDRVTGTFQVEVVVENADLALRPGMFTRVSINLGQIEALLVPALAVMKQVGSNERFVFVEENGVAHRKSVLVGRNIDDMQEILSGIEPGQNLVVAGQHNLIHLGKVQLQN